MTPYLKSGLFLGFGLRTVCKFSKQESPLKTKVDFSKIKQKIKSYTESWLVFNGYFCFENLHKVCKLANFSIILFRGVARGWSLGARAPLPPPRDQNSIQIFKFFYFQNRKINFFTEKCWTLLAKSILMFKKKNKSLIWRLYNSDFFKNKKLGTPLQKSLILFAYFSFFHSTRNKSVFRL